MIQWSNSTRSKQRTGQYLSIDNGDHCHHVFLNLGMFLASLKLISLQADYRKVVPKITIKSLPCCGIVFL